MAGWMWSTKEYLDYNTYKSKISSIWDGIWNTVDSIWDKIDLGGNSDIGGLDFDGWLASDVKTYDNDENTEQVKRSENSKNQTIKSFPKSVRFVDFSQLEGGNKSGNYWLLTWYSKSDLIWVINKYIEKNLDDDTDILVTVEYEDDSSNPQKIILQTQKKSTGEKHLVGDTSDLFNEIFDGTKWEDSGDIEDYLDKDIVSDNSNNQIKDNIQSVKKTTSTKLTQKEQEEAEEILNILF